MPTNHILHVDMDAFYASVEQLLGPAAKIAGKIKTRIRADTGLIASVGVAPNRYLAKLASDSSKPDGLLVIDAERITEFLWPLPVGRIWGIGKKGEQRLRQIGIRTIGELAATPVLKLIDQFGDSGHYMWDLAHGRDDRPVVADREAKSVSTETTFARDIADREVLRSWLLELVEQLGQRIRQIGVRTRTVELKLRSADFRTHTRSLTLSTPTDVTDLLWTCTAELFEQRIAGTMLPARLLGVGASGLVREGEVQRELFEETETEKKRSLDKAMDALRAQFGSDIISRGKRLE